MIRYLLRYSGELVDPSIGARGVIEQLIAISNFLKTEAASGVLGSNPGHNLLLE